MSVVHFGAVGWYLGDRQGSVRTVVTGAGATVGAATYSGFGARTVTTGVVDRYGYTGREWDGVLGLQYGRARMYDPAAGRWLSEDPLGFAAGDPNLHRYVGNSPTNATDPSGLQSPALLTGPELPQPVQNFGAGIADGLLELLISGYTISQAEQRGPLIAYLTGQWEYAIPGYPTGSALGGAIGGDYDKYRDRGIDRVTAGGMAASSNLPLTSTGMSFNEWLGGRSLRADDYGQPLTARGAGRRVPGAALDLAPFLKVPRVGVKPFSVKGCPPAGSGGMFPQLPPTSQVFPELFPPRRGALDLPNVGQRPPKPGAGLNDPPLSLRPGGTRPDDPVVEIVPPWRQGGAGAGGGVPDLVGAGGPGRPPVAQLGGQGPPGHPSGPTDGPAAPQGGGTSGGSPSVPGQPPQAPGAGVPPTRSGLPPLELKPTVSDVIPR